jgi:hypothetical protein
MTHSFHVSEITDTIMDELQAAEIVFLVPFRQIKVIKNIPGDFLVISFYVVL